MKTANYLLRSQGASPVLGIISSTLIKRKERDKERNSTESTLVQNLGSQNLSWLNFITFLSWEKRLSNHTNSVNRLTRELCNLTTTFSLGLYQHLTES